MSIKNSFGQMLPKLMTALSLAFVFSSLSALSEENQHSKPACGPGTPPEIRDATALQGQGSLIANQDDTVTIALDLNEDSLVDLLYRVAPTNPAALFEQISDGSFSNEEMAIIDRQTSSYHEVEIVFTARNNQDILFYVDSRDCWLADEPSESSQAMHKVFSAQAIGVQHVTSEAKSANEVLDAARDTPIIIRESSQNDTQSLPFCFGGGPGSSQCSYNFGGYGPIEAGSCSVSCVPPFYACCGPGLGSYCACVLPDNNSPIPGPNLPPGGPGDGGDGGDSGGGPGGSEGGGTPGPGSGPGDDDDDDDEDPGDEESYCVDC